MGRKKSPNAAWLTSRRELLVRMLSGGVFAIPGITTLSACTSVMGERPAPLPADRSVWRAEGDFLVDGETGDEQTLIRPGSVIETGPDGGLIFAVGNTACFARRSTRLRLDAAPDDAGRVGIVDLRAGAVLSVFAPGEYSVRTPLAVVGIRGTGVYAQVEADQDYICTCYGSVDITARADPTSREVITSVRHDAPRYVLAGGAAGTRVQTAPFKDHDDQELLLIEALVGRVPPYPVSGNAYGVPSRRTY